jgi:hypothetical protein
MSKRKSALAMLDFKRVDPLGLSEEADSSRDVEAVATYHVESILPDPNQPRTLLPAHLAEQVYGGQMMPRQAVVEWERLAAEAGKESPVAHLLEKVKELAGSIAQHGLINPITIRPRSQDDPVPDEIEYRIVTGERRWWAHVYLATKGESIQEGHERKSAWEIKASLTPDGANIRAHQLVENWLREDISVVEKAYGLWALRCEMSGLPFGDYEDRELVNWQDVEAALQISRRQRRRIVRLLELTTEAQALINSHQLSERSVRPIAMKLTDYPDLQLQALNQIVAWIANDQPYGERQVVRLVEKLLIQAGVQEKIVVVPNRPTQFQANKFRSRVRSTLKLVSDLNEEGLATAVETVAGDDQLVTELQQLRSLIDQILPD